jgi:hypothetical protein
VIKPQRLEDGITNTQNLDVLHGLLAQIIVEAKNLVLVKVYSEDVIDLARTFKMSGDQLLQDDARERLVTLDRLH